MESSLCEKPERHAPRRLSDHLMLEGQKQKVHSLVDKVYSRENLKLAWERVRANRGASGADSFTSHCLMHSWLTVNPRNSMISLSLAVSACSVAGRTPRRR